MRRTVLGPALLGASILALGATAAPAPMSLQQVLLAGDTPASVRAHLLAHTARIEGEHPDAAVQALRLTARSYERAGLRDSAIVTLRRSLALRDDSGDRLTLADLLLRRRQDGDIPDAIALLEAVKAAGFTSRTVFAHTTGLLAWAHDLAGQSATALATLKPATAQLLREDEWRYRVARILFDARHYREAFQAVKPLAVQARLQDAEVSELLRKISDASGVNQVSSEVERGVFDADKQALAELAAFGGQRVRFFAPDGFGLGGVLVVPDGPGPHRGVIVVANPGDAGSVYDSLAVGLRTANFAVLVLDVRGSGWSVAPACPLMETWEGRHERMLGLAAEDVRVAWSYLAAVAPLDTTRFAIVATQHAAPIAAAAAAADPHVAALVLVSPRCEPVERGPLRARIAERPLPLFLEMSPEDNLEADFYDALYQASDRGASRLVEGRGSSGAVLFRRDPGELSRLTQWLDQRFKAFAPPAARPTRRR